jgi:hypothetical protein
VSDNPDFKLASDSLIDDLNNFNEGLQRWQDVKRSIRFNVEQMIAAHDLLIAHGCQDPGGEEDMNEKEIRRAILYLAGSTTAAVDQSVAMTDTELGEVLLSGHWTTVEVHEAGRRLVSRASDAECTPRKKP